jgi:hypothetical protein
MVTDMHDLIGPTRCDLDHPLEEATVGLRHPHLPDVPM